MNKTYLDSIPDVTRRDGVVPYGKVELYVVKARVEALAASDPEFGRDRARFEEQRGVLW